ncbi:MAG: HEAT repeat domain-containing protein [Planctomycetota bacterium]|nr:HEAT repeat domain-containing protein [Planctomycetota bacterium]
MDAGRPGTWRSKVVIALLLVLCAAFLFMKDHTGPLAPTAKSPKTPPARSPLYVWSTVDAFPGHEGLVNKAAWTSNSLVLTAGRDHTARLWTSGGKELAVLRGHLGPVLDAQLSPDGKRIVTASVDGTAMLWDREGKIHAIIRTHTGAVRRAAFDPDGTRILTVGLDGDARLHPIDGSPAELLDDDGAATVEAAFVHEAIVTRDAAGVMRSYRRADDGTQQRTDSSGVADMHVTPRGDLVVIQHDGAVVVHRRDDRPRKLTGHGAQALDVDVHPETGEAVTASLDGTARLWSRDSEPLAVLKDHGFGVVRARIAPDGQTILTLDASGVARLWRRDGSLHKVLAPAGMRDVGFVTGYPRGVWGIPAASTGLRLWTLEGDDEGAHATSAGRVLEVSRSPDGRRLLLHAADRSVRAITVERWDRKLDGPKRPEKETAAPAVGTLRGDYLGAEGCADCHRKEYDLWVASNHARSLEAADLDNVPDAVREEDVAEHPPGETSFMAHKGMFLATTLGADGQERGYRLGWVAGRARIRMYVAEMADGRMQVLPGMRSELTDSWFDYTHLLFSPSDTTIAPVVRPGDDAFWTGQGRSWGTKCAHCHSSGAEPRVLHEDGPGRRAVVRDLGVDCEACHGPGREHAEAWQRLETDAPLPKLQELEPGRSIASCTRCHMEGERLKATWDPDEDFYEFLDPTLLLDPDRVDARGRPLELIYHGLSFAVSRCANESELTCVKCHDAHGGELPALLSRAPTNDHLCSDCHVELVRDVAGHSHHDALGSGGSCVGCHMPRLVIERGHGIITDHSISVPDPDAKGDRVAQDACTWCHQLGLGSPADAPFLDDAALKKAYRDWWPNAQRSQPWMEAIAAGRTRADDATAALTKVVEDTEAYRLVRASATRLLGRQSGQGTAALMKAAKDPDPLVRRSALTALAAIRSKEVDALYLRALEDPKASVRSAAARAALEGWERIRANRPLLDGLLPVLRAEAEALPNDEMRWFRLGAALDVSGDAARAIEAYERMLLLHPLAKSVRARLEELRSQGR